MARVSLKSGKVFLIDWMALTVYILFLKCIGIYQYLFHYAFFFNFLFYKNIQIQGKASLCSNLVFLNKCVFFCLLKFHTSMEGTIYCFWSYATNYYIAIVFLKWETLQHLRWKSEVHKKELLSPINFSGILAAPLINMGIIV